MAQYLIAPGLPFVLERVPLLLIWHLRYDGDSVHLWIRSQVKERLLSAGLIPTFNKKNLGI
jgi:hypothetical protein